MSEALLKKLHYKGGKSAVWNAPEGYRLGIEPSGQEPEPAEASLDFVQLFVKDAAEVREWVPKAVARLNEDAVFWITYPKSGSKFKTDINRDKLWPLVQELAPYRPVSNVAIDDRWSALRFRLVDRVKKG